MVLHSNASSPTAMPADLLLTSAESPANSMDPNNDTTSRLQSMSDTDRLIDALRRGLADLGRKNEENTNRLQKAIDGIRPKPVATDKETAFWTAYQTLSDEHDKEFHQKYSTDLDTSLIFAGLFSAVVYCSLCKKNKHISSVVGSIYRGIEH
ncbi:hypothetical protein DFH07DRAFT_810114 [Mycena maculata]|uniref:DUF6535 domain-containing protein n=1 Tax=Mycena maculata TaxID=230809 RepID=A0AAD7JJ18_9AGAR|nr:hypothetical protein DFH07DRAFT_810114 [Mycena maculata]